MTLVFTHAVTHEMIYVCHHQKGGKMLVKGLSDRVPQRPLSNIRSRILMITKILAYMYCS